MTLNVTLPDSLYKKAMEVADRERISVERVVYSALAEQLNALERLQDRAARFENRGFAASPIPPPPCNTCNISRNTRGNNTRRWYRT
jgi:hypothetical protein